jgi:hypothetical protein
MVSHAQISLVVTILSVIAATLFLIGAMVGLYYIKNPRATLGTISGLTIGFALCLGLFTNARRQDVFAATAA